MSEWIGASLWSIGSELHGESLGYRLEYVGHYIREETRWIEETRQAFDDLVKRCCIIRTTDGTYMSEAGCH